LPTIFGIEEVDEEVKYLLDIAITEYIISFIFLLNVGIILYSLVISNEELVWKFGLYTLIGITLIFVIDESIDPILLGISVLSLAYPLYSIPSNYIKEKAPIFQGIGMLFLLIQDDVFNEDISTFAVIFLAWVILLFGIWFLRGTENQLFISMASVYVLAGISSLLLIEGEYSVNVEVLLISVISVTLFSLFLMPRVKQMENLYPISALVAVCFAMVALSELVQDMVKELQLDSAEEYIYRLSIDWLIFLPVMVEVILVLRKFTQDQVQTITGDYRILYVIGGFVVLASVIGINGIYSLKILLLCVTFWMIALNIDHEIAAWSASIFTIFTAGWVIIALGTEIDVEGDKTDGIVLYFSFLAFVGLVMLIVSYFNESRYKGEPLTASLAVTGSLLTFATILVPYWIGQTGIDIAGGIHEGYEHEQLIKFLPNIVWAIQGLILFLFSDKFAKLYLRRLALGILTVDIVKSGYEIMLAADDVLIQGIAAVSLGSILIFIFYRFGSIDENDG
jgi:hypothetical protein